MSRGAGAHRCRPFNHFAMCRFESELAFHRLDKLKLPTAIASDPSLNAARDVPEVAGQQMRLARGIGFLEVAFRRQNCRSKRLTDAFHADLRH